MLVLKKLILDGFLSYGKNVEIPLDPKGITFIQGLSGVGKSTIFEGILYALFGKIIRKKGSVSNLSNKYLNENYFSIQLDFTVNEDVCSVKESRNKNKIEISFTINEKECSGKTYQDTRKRIQDKIGITFDAFKSFVVFGQRQAQQLVEGSANDRLDILIDIFNLKQYEEYLAKAIEYQKKLETKKEKIEQEIEYINVDITKYVVQEDEFSIEEINRQVSEKEVVLDELNQKNYACRQKLLSQNKLNKLVDDINQCQKEIDSIVQLDIPDDSHNKGCYFFETYEYLREEFLELEEDLQFVVDGICPISKKKCDGTIAFCSVKEKYQISSIEELNKVVNDYSDYLKQVKDKSDYYLSFDNYLRELPKLTTKLLDLKETYTYLTNQSIIEENIDYTVETVNLDNQIKLIKKDIDELKKIQERVMIYETTKKLLAGKEERYTFLKEELKKHIEVCKLATASVAVFKKLKFYKLDSIINCLTHETNAILENIHDSCRVQFSTNKETASNKKTIDQVNMLVYLNNMELPIDMVSDGQRTIISIAVMLGIIQTTYKLSKFRLNTIFLDEPFNTLPDGAIAHIFEAICNISNELNLGIKIISHRDLNHGLIDNYILVDREDGVSSVKVISNA